MARTKTMATYLINAPHDQTINTLELGTVSCLVYSNPAFFEPKERLARDFGAIVVGDQIILCSNGVLRYVAQIAEVIDATDASGSKEYHGTPVRLLKGPVVTRLNNVGIGAAAESMHRAGTTPPRLINTKRTGFKQGAFCERLTEEQAAALRSW